MYRRKIKFCWVSLIAVCLWMVYFNLNIDISTRASNGMNISRHMDSTSKEYTKINFPHFGEEIKITHCQFIIESIQTAVGRYNTTIFLIEPSVLRSISNTITNNTALHDLDVVTFGIIGRYDETWESFCEKLKSYGFSARYSTDIFDREVKPIKSVTTHIIIQHTKYIKPVVHIVVFYKKQQFFLWHSHLLSPERRLTFARKAGIYTYFTTETHYLDGIHVLTPSPVSEFLNGLKESEFIQCNFSRAKQFYRKYPTYTKNKEGILFQREGVRIISIVSKVFNRLGIPFELCAGSLLGWYRQCDILPYGDIDLEMFPADYKPIIIKALQNEGMKLKHIFGRINDSYELTFYSPGDVRLDLFMIYEEDKNSYWQPSISFDTGEKYKYVFPKFTLCWTTLQNILVRIPCNYDENVRTFFGDNWETPVEEWDYESSHKNIQHNGFWPKHEWKEVKQTFF